MIKWKLLISTIPFIIVVLLMRTILNDFLGFHGIIEFSEIVLVLTGGIFLVGFMLSGTLSDYKESEKFPGEIACIYETMEESIHMNYKNSKIKKAKLIYLELIFNSVTDLKKWLHKTITRDDFYRSLEELSGKIIDGEKDGLSPKEISKILGDIHSLRRIVTRIDVISRTGFLMTGYALLEVLISSIVLILLISIFKSEIAEKILIAFVTMIYIYMYKLIKDIDDPFEYSANDQHGATEIPLFPIDEYIQRLKEKLQDK